ncbi:MAG: formate dehydrogenase subunit gamma [Thalassobaculales bacterium]
MKAFLATLGLALLLLGGPAVAQPAPTAPVLAPATNAPSVQGPNARTEMWRAIRQGEQGSVTIADTRAGVMIQSEGENWRALRNGPLSVYGSWALLGMIGLLAVFFALRGRIRIEAGPAGSTIERFSGVDRFAHWLTATCFIVLALTGLNLLYGRYVLLPLIGPQAFSLLTIWGKYAHNYLAFGFMLGIVMMFVLWVRHNIPGWHDVIWVLKGGGLFVKGVHPPSRKFNAGQKVIFWSVILGGAAVSVSGVYLMFPLMFADMQQMQWMQVVHAAVAIVLIAIIVAHIYIGSVGMEGAFDAMGTGRVDLNWAREHHNLWVAEVLGEKPPRHGHD